MAEVNSPASNLGNNYIGRFAPSPTGPLHFGSLLAALASYLDARSSNGTWLLRMEDLDPPREPAGTDQIILDQLQALELSWDGEVLYQSSRLPAYEECLQQLTDSGLCFRCDCSRPRIKSLGSVYDGHCRDRDLGETRNSAIRLRVDNSQIEFCDQIQGAYSQRLIEDVGDFILRRKDGLFAYQLAVVVDDAFQNINRIVRGYDLLDSTPRQIYLQRILGFPTPSYAHIPVVTNEQGQKLSKQHFAEPIDTRNGSEQVLLALKFLGQQPPDSLRGSKLKTILEWAREHWDIQAVPKLANMPLCS
ncbi:MAG: tRNA glutamyl-Q(34) synthetase GluQRS [Proteobacteria bacterium]|nr:tRNA glutamyl-Q(34) synthetase GluQRS [Pseudomonadota bacterium]MDA0926822.1 tRNA glutamyl-Q(34) synthetase GluQRS [Pseudomonadota bacterium]